MWKMWGNGVVKAAAAAAVVEAAAAEAAAATMMKQKKVGRPEQEEERTEPWEPPPAQGLTTRTLLADHLGSNIFGIADAFLPISFHLCLLCILCEQCDHPNDRWECLSLLTLAKLNGMTYPTTRTSSFGAEMRVIAVLRATRFPQLVLGRFRF